MLYCVALEITETRHNHNQTVGSKPGKIRPVVVLLVIAFVTPDWKINSNEIHKIYLPSLKWFLFSSAWCCSVQLGLCGGSGKIGKLVWTDRLPSNQTRFLVSGPAPIGCWQSSVFSRQECGVIVVNFAARALYKEQKSNDCWIIKRQPEELKRFYALFRRLQITFLFSLTQI